MDIKTDLNELLEFEYEEEWEVSYSIMPVRCSISRKLLWFTKTYSNIIELPWYPVGITVSLSEEEYIMYRLSCDA